MKKKIDLFWYWFIFVVAFVLCFFVVNNKNVGAYSLDSNGNIVSDNLFKPNVISYSNGINFNYDIESGYINFDGIQNTTSWSMFIDEQRIDLSSYTHYYLKIFGENVYHPICIRTFFNDGSQIDWYYNSDTNYLHFYESMSIVKITMFFDYVDLGLVINGKLGIFLTNDVNLLSNFEPYGVWYSETNAENKYLGRLPSFTSSLTYDNEDIGETLTIYDVNSYIDNSFGYLYFDRLWQYLDNLTSSSYSDARVTINFNENLNINTSYIINSNKQNYGSGVWFYQNNDLMLDVRNFYNNQYCGGASQYSCNVELNKYVNIGSGSNSFSYLNKIVVWSATTDERTLAFGYNNIGYNTGYDNGYSVGYKDGKDVSDNLIYDKGYTNGYNVGYDKGINYASNGGNTLVGLVGAIFTSPVNMLQTIFDFEFLGINLTNFLFSLISLFIVIWLIKMFL